MNYSLIMITQEALSSSLFLLAEYAHNNNIVGGLLIIMMMTIPMYVLCPLIGSIIAAAAGLRIRFFLSYMQLAAQIANLPINALDQPTTLFLSSSLPDRQFYKFYLAPVVSRAVDIANL